MKLERKTRRQPGKCACLKSPLDACGDVRTIGDGRRSRCVAATRQEMVVLAADEWSGDQERRER